MARYAVMVERSEPQPIPLDRQEALRELSDFSGPLMEPLLDASSVHIAEMAARHLQSVRSLARGEPDGSPRWWQRSSANPEFRAAEVAVYRLRESGLDDDAIVTLVDEKLAALRAVLPEVRTD